MDILMLVRGEYKPDMRIRREAEYLTKHGHNVHVVSKKRGQKTKKEILNNVEITRIGFESKLGFYIDEGIYTVTWYQPLLIWKLRKLIQNNTFDVIYYHNIHYAKVATKLGRRYDLTIVSELHELYAEDVKTWRESSTLRDRIQLSRLLKPTWRFKSLERFAVNYTDVLITVSRGLREYFVSRYDYDGPSEIIRNVPDLDRLDQMPIYDLEYDDDEFIISYIGGFTPQRGLELAIESMVDVLQEVPNARLILVGDGRDSYVTKLKNKAKSLDVYDRIEFTGWVEFEKVRSYYEASDVSLAPMRQNHKLNDILPNKLFQSMAFRTPVIVSDIQSMKQIVQETKSGFVIGDPYSLSEAILELHDNNKLREAMGKRGRIAIENKYNMGSEITKLDQILRNNISNE
ncbi:glycosyltransferase family 4 protein [Halobacterium salinarum]|uniref:glycosyltransferase family 4 protein n=1 Tax=Halobacterium salinarum TaxID=2242 RepID=UPI002553E13E|nr:glycosyltransferase family 4 protein [Halobacterium salinarum]MDL0121112.1 glycosyltransferase family 4 protein [Halobacterium salinarum]MDL0135793.1 glycosyltransferase family 4 protein [Halobacterium salinarum]MDL0138283.1 glycosyltransferase family 4 protein [Halobacterium salinarum]